MELLAHFDKVVLMANGRIHDAGTVEELLRRQPAFREMLKHPPEATSLSIKQIAAM
jgi:ABC-type transport system involved in cytochrome bd biosynthesis fused ATPase/permease subunit